jgi:hypothetical protein
MHNRKKEGERKIEFDCDEGLKREFSIARHEYLLGTIN